MSGIFGIWNFDRRPVDLAVLERMGTALAHRGPEAAGTQAHDHVALGCRILRITPESARETQPVLAPGSMLVFDGRLDNREELLGALERKATPDCPISDPELVLAAYRKFGEGFPEHLLGEFAFALADIQNDRLLLVRDPLGVRPLYYVQTPAAVIFASEIRGLLVCPDVPSEPNQEALARMVFDGGSRDPFETFFCGISTLPPSHALIANGRMAAVRQYWDFDSTRETRFCKTEDYLEAFRHYFSQAVRRRLRSMWPVAVAVSGGLDSSSIFTMAETLNRSGQGGAPVLGLSFVAEKGTRAYEQEYVEEIERQYGVGIIKVPMVTAGFFDTCDDQVRQCEAPFLDAHWSTYHALHGAAKQRRARVLMCGNWGDQLLFTGAYLVDLAGQFRWGKMWRHLQEFPRWNTDADPSFFRRRFLEDLQSKVVQKRISKLLRPLLRRMRAMARQTPPMQAVYTDSFRNTARPLIPAPGKGRAFHSVYAERVYQICRSRYDVLGMELLNKIASFHGMEVTYPFLDHDFVSFMMSIPGEIQNLDGVPRGILRQALRGILPNAIMGRRWKADYSDLDNDAVQRAYPEIVRYLEQNRTAAVMGYVDRIAMKRELMRVQGQLCGPSCEFAWALLNLLALETWLKAFFFRQDAERAGSIEHAAGS